jgi:transcription elongation GreA/GreB family factor
MFNAQVIEPEEQNINVQVGNGVEIRYYDGTTFRFILEGYWLGSLENRVSVYGPLGQALFGAKKGEKRTLKLDREEKNIIVIDIILPSIVKKTYKN